MLQLMESDYEEVEKCLQVASPSFVFAVLNKKITGFVYGDPSNKNNYLIGTVSGIFYVTGDETNNEFKDGLVDLYNKNEQSRFTLFSSSEKWDKAISDLFKSEERVHSFSRYTFAFNQLKNINNRVKLPKEFTVKKINAEIIHQSIYFNEEYYEEYWGSVSNYLENGFGYCVFHNDTLVSECTSIFRAEKVAEMDILTKSERKGKGLAKVTAQSFINHCMEENITPRWDCSVDNIASISMANTIGFEHPTRYSVFAKIM
ncbi:GNAT family N-acetyltransferase [Peribacillus sp. NPDC097675]|uniref:GNAT family N-acetyltransferase n=1 Tax=Peribacillus sp. NPDC097675 TaxID=3390618 RepID=UPI003D056F81